MYRGWERGGARGQEKKQEARKRGKRERRSQTAPVIVSQALLDVDSNCGAEPRLNSNKNKY